jgi:hypothetical protein
MVFFFEKITANVAVCSRIRSMVIGYSGGNCQIMEEEYCGGMVIPLGITCSWTRDRLEEWYFRRELPAHGRGIHLRNTFRRESKAH